MKVSWMCLSRKLLGKACIMEVCIVSMDCVESLRITSINRSRVQKLL